ncbi:MAG: DnaJ C-terminal domain-containing protein [Candidatus Electryonea clarkiae]|nr:DnaJ C-terminal domain-containing protein [Candidatus Electryonea clarkiae]MDP8285302.1 DnaJ C-terminal domain-containing protein [Candidatus Electryonea clarkiae]
MSVKYTDYYEAIGVDRKASQQEITKKYRQLARTYHPDVNKSPDAEDRFKAIQEAYAVLKDPAKRKRYDALGANWEHGQEFRPPPGWGSSSGGFNRGDAQNGFRFGGSNQSDFSDFFDSIFGGFSPGTKGGRSRKRSQRNRDIEGELKITLEEALEGGVHRITLSPHGLPSKTIDVKIPKGIKEGSKIKIPGQGADADGFGQAGDLLLKFKFHPHEYFVPDKFNLNIQVPLSPWEAALGAKIPVPTLEGNVLLTIKPGVSTGQKLKIPGKGLQKKDGNRGDIIVEFELIVPKKLSSKEENLFKELSDSSDFNPRSW